MVRRLSAISLSVLVGAGVSLAAPVAASAAEPRTSSEHVVAVDSASFLPSWAKPINVTGAREVWIAPVVGVGQPEWDGDALPRGLPDSASQSIAVF